MEIRTLRYFLMVAKEGNITRAADLLHLSQPTLSRQLMQLEEELGTTLFERGKRQITLTEAGFILKRRAEEIVELTELAGQEVAQRDDHLRGQVTIGCGITAATQMLGTWVKHFQQLYPDVIFHIHNGNTELVMEKIDHGLLDIGLVIGPLDLEKYAFICLPEKEPWGLLMRRDDPLAQSASLPLTVIKEMTLIGSPREDIHRYFQQYLGLAYQDLKVVSTSDLSSTSAILVKNGIGKSLSVAGSTCDLDPAVYCFRPFEPAIYSQSYLIWKKYQVQPLALTKFLEFVQNHSNIE